MGFDATFVRDHIAEAQSCHDVLDTDPCMSAGRNSRGQVLSKLSVVDHRDLCHRKGKLHVVVNFSAFNDREGEADSWVYVYKAGTLAFITNRKTPELIYGAGRLLSSTADSVASLGTVTATGRSG